MRRVIFISTMISLSLAAGMQATLTTSPNTVGTTSTLLIQLKLDDSVGVSTSGGFRLSVPSTFGTQIQCAVVDPPTISLVQDSITGTRCQLVTPTTITMTLSSGSLLPSQSVFMQITSFVNPSSTGTNSGFVLSTFDATGITTSSLGGLSVSGLQPGVLSATLQTMTDGIGLKNPNTALILAFSVTNDLPCSSTSQNCSLNLQLPYLQPSDAPTQNSVIDHSALKCEISKNSTVSFGFFTLQTFFPSPCSLISDSLSPSKSTLSFTQLTNALVPKATPIKFRVWGFMNPIDLQPLTGFVAKTSDGAGLIQVSQVMTVSVTQPAIINNATAALVSGSSQIMGISNVQLDFIVPVPLKAGCSLGISVPSDFSNLSLSLSAVKVYGMFGFITSLPFVVNGQQIQVTGACTSYLDNSSPASVRLEGLQNPSIVKDTATFKIMIADSQGGTLATTQSALIVTSASFSPGTFQSAALVFSNPTVQETSGLVINIQPNHALSMNGRVIFTLPSEFVLNNSSSVVVNSLKSINSTQIQVSANTTTNRFIVRYMFYSFGYNPAIDGPLVFNLTSIIANNPSHTLPSESIIIQTYDLVAPATTTTSAVYGLVDQTNLSTNALILPGSFKQFNFTTDSSTSNTFPASATINVTLSHAVSAGSFVYLNLPADIGVGQQLSSCTSAVGFLAVSPSCSFTILSDGTTQVVVSGTKNLVAGSVLSFKLTSIRMPRYQGFVLGSIIISTGLSVASLIDSTSTSFFTQNAQVFSNASISQGSYVCSDLNNLTVTLTKPVGSVQIQPSDVFVLPLPPGDFTFDSQQLVCKLSGLLTACTFDQTKRVLQIGNLTDATSYQFTISGLRNAQSLKPAIQVSAAFIDSNQRLLIVTPSTALLSLKTVQAGVISTLRMLQSNTNPQASADYSFSFNPKIYPPVVFATVDLPTCMSFTSVLANQLNQTYSQLIATMVTPQRVQVQLSLNSSKTTDGFTLIGLLNPTESCLAKGGVQISLFEDSSLQFLMASGTVIPSLSCIGLCTACSFGQKDFCTACASGFALLADSGNCTQVCPQGSTFDAITNKCSTCDSSCSLCSGSTSFCTKCADTSLFATSNGTCVSENTCLKVATMFVNTTKRTCEQCQMPCTSCSMTGCTACNQGYSLLQGSCVDVCPVGTNTKNTTTGTVCEGEPSAQIAGKLLSDAPLLYLTIVLFLVAAVLKVTCFKEMSLLVTLVIVTNLVETISLLKLASAAAKSNNLVTSMGMVQLGFLRFTPLGSFIALLTLNIYVVSSHCRFLKPSNTSSASEESQYVIWTLQRSFKRTLIYTVACLFSFHNINWFNYFGMFPESLKQNLKQFIEFYSFVSKISMGFPRAIILVYCGYFGILNAHGQLSINSEFMADLVAWILEQCVLCLLSIFLLFLALNFSWYDDPTEIIKQHEQQQKSHDDTAEDPQDLYVPKSSIEMHMLKSSRVFKQKQTLRTSVYAPSQFKSSVDSLQFGFKGDRESKLETIQQVGPASNEKHELSGIPESCESSDLNFDFLEDMKQTIMRSKRNKPTRAANVSEGKHFGRQSVSTERTIKTQRFRLKHLTTMTPGQLQANTKKSVQPEDDEVTVTTAHKGFRKESGKKDSVTKESVMTARTKPASLIQDFDSDLFKEGSEQVSAFESPASVKVVEDLSPVKLRTKISKFATSAKKL